METLGNYNINGYQDFGATLREQKQTALINCIPVFAGNLKNAGFGFSDFFLALSTYCDQFGYSQSIVKSLEVLAENFENISQTENNIKAGQNIR